MLVIVNVTIYVIILGVFSIAGWKIAGNYAKRVTDIQQLLGMLHMLQTEIVHNRAPLSDALERIGHSMQGVAGWFCVLVNAHMQEMFTVQAAWDRGLEALSIESALLTPEIDTLASLGMMLGLSHTEDQERHLKLAIVRLERLLEDARLEATKNVRLWRYLGFMAGMLVVILLL